MNERAPRIVLDTQRRLSQLSVVRAFAFGTAAGLLSWFLISLVLQGLSPAVSVTRTLASVLVGFAVAAAVAWQLRVREGRITQSRAALWLEEHFPGLQFSLVTLAEFDRDSSRELSTQARERLVAAVGQPDVSVPLNRSAVTQLRVPVLLALMLAVVTLPLHGRISQVVGDSSGARARAAANKSNATDARDGKTLAKWQVRVVPPAYSGLASQTLNDAGQVAALVGSRIEVAGNDAQAPSATVHSTVDSVVPKPLEVASTQSSWRVGMVMPPSPADVRFVSGTANRQLLLEPRADSLPVVRLQLPVRDSVYREAKGAVSLDALAHDDLGLASINYELIVTSGEGERFTAKTVVIGAQRLDGDHERRWQAAISLDTMKLLPGDIVHMRAVARDRHPDAARELGASETRTFRIARANEYDSVAVEPAPPPEVQKSLMSQRMLLILTEKLAARTKTISHDLLVAESRKLAGDQSRLRKTIGNLVFQRLEGEDGGEHAHSADDGHDHGVTMDQGKLVQTSAGAAGAPMTDGEEGDSPIVAINKPLLEAFNAMWDAASALEIAEPKNAIPHMKLALAAIERARSAERIYLRGKPPVVIVDIAKVRLVGKDTGQINTRAAREALSPRQAARESRLLSAALLLTRDANAGRDSLALLRLESLSDAPALASALNDVLEVVRRGGDATQAIIRARRLLSGGAKSDSLTGWRGML